ncbi:MAG: glycosyltransferase [Candidatus Firestonebacteria bacterium]|nr:glycosyltransferase [Candidatus Firestonebacteria bacterium]
MNNVPDNNIYDFLILSASPRNTGCFLRAKYIALSLERSGAKVKLAIPCKSKPFMFDFIINFFKYLYYVLLIDYKVGMSIKPYPNTLIPLLIKKILKKNKVIVDIDDVDFGYRGGILSSILRSIQKPFPKYFDLVTFHNKLLRDFIIKEFNVLPEKLHTLLQGVDFSVFDCRLDVTEFKEEFIKKNNLNNDTTILIYPAHLNIASDLDIILSNIKDILNRENILLIIAGGGQLFDEFKKSAHKLDIKNIYFTGYLSPDKIAEYILISDFALVYYKDRKVNYYRSSMKLRECMALKKKIICNNVGELKSFEQFTYQSESDIKSFIDLLDKCLKQYPVDTREKEGYEYIKKNYNWDLIGKEFVEFIKTI